MRRTVALLVTLISTLFVLPSTPAAAALPPQPGAYTGKGFDTCTAPSQSAMNTWRNSSPYRAIGIYISGASRSCAQPNLTATWVANQVNNGWRLIPIELGYQAPCGTRTPKMSANTTTARSQGVTAANSAVNAAQALGIVAGSTIYNDIEHYPSTTSCKAAVLSFLSGWVEQARFSPDGKRIGAIACNWQAGVWDSATGRLLRRLDIERGEYVDHCGLAFSKDNRFVAVASLDKAQLWDLLNAFEHTGIKLTESYAMWPAAAVSGLYFSHPESRYFSVDRLTRDQVEDYAGRKGMTIKDVERWLASNLGYDPKKVQEIAA